MAETLLNELSNTDIDWLVTHGQRETIAAGTVLVHSCQDTQFIYLLLDGVLSLVVPQPLPDATSDGGSGQGVSLALLERPLLTLTRGELVGETALFNFCAMPAIVKAAETALVLAVPTTQIQAKLTQDTQFSAHFYRAMALILSHRLRQLIAASGQRHVSHQPMKDALFVFAELRDSDVDWLMAVGQVEKLPAGKVLIHAGRPVDALYLVLDGLLSIAVPQGNYDPLALCFQGLEKQNLAQTVIAHFTRGEIAGAISALELRPFPTTIRAVQESLVLTVPRHELAAKLEQDLGFSTRFYRVIAIQILNSLQTVMNQLGCDQKMYGQDQDLDEEIEYDDELCLTSLRQLSQGAARFNWMLKRLGII